MKHHMHISGIYPTGIKTAYHQDFNRFPEDLYTVYANQGDVTFTSGNHTEREIREAFGLSQERFEKLVVN